MKTSLAIGTAAILLVGMCTSAFGVSEECLQVRKEIQQAGKSYENFLSVWEAHRPSGDARCEDLRGQWFCFQCLESNKTKLIHVLFRPNGQHQIKGYGCPCKKDE